MKRKYSALILSLLALIITINTPLPASAEGLAKLRESFVQYQTKPMDRAGELYKQHREVQKTEDGLARQYGIPRSAVRKYEMSLSNLIRAYESLHDLRRHGRVLHITLPDEARMAYFASKEPPYSFLLYLDLFEDVYNCKREIEREEAELETANRDKVNFLEERGRLERNYRLVSSRKKNREGDMLELHWNEMVSAINLEATETDIAYNRLYASFLETTILELKTKLTMLEEFLKKIRSEVDVTENDLLYLDSLVYSRLSAIEKKEQALRIRYEAISSLEQKAENPTEATGYFISTEEAQIISEIQFLSDLRVYGESIRYAFSVMDEILEGDYKNYTCKDVLAYTAGYIKILNEAENRCLSAIHTIRSAEQEIERRFYIRNIALNFQDTARLDEEKRSFAERKTRYLEYISDIGKIRQLCTLLNAEVNRMEGGRTREKKIEDLWYSNIRSISDKELWHIGEYPITYERLIKGIAAFLICITLTKIASGWFCRKSKKRGRLTSHEILLVEKSITGTGFLLSVLATLSILRIPLTALAFLGGAMAIALGLGTQKIMGDFFAGILLLFQGKIRVGDEVVIDEVRGTVTELTIQKTVLRTAMNKELVIPNSKVHDSAIINLTLTNSRLMLKVEVGVGYESDVKRVTEILLEIVKKHPATLKKPEPVIIFSEFEDSSLLFEARFFIDLKKHFESVVKSDIRYAIVEAFEKEGINIPYPQRDVHFIGKE